MSISHSAKDMVRHEQMTHLVHRTHVYDAVPLRRHLQDLIQDLLHIELFTLSEVNSVDNWGIFHLQLLQHTTPGGYRQRGHI